MKKLYTTLFLLVVAGLTMAQGLRVQYKNGRNVDWNYNDFDSIVVSGGPDYYETTLPKIMKQNPNISLFTEALELTGLSDEMQQWQDYNYNPSLYEDISIYTNGYWDYCHVPEEKRIQFTVFACPNEVLATRYGITDMQKLYEYARGLYGGDTWDMVQAAPAKLKDRQNPLRRLVAYNCLGQLGTYDMLTTICTIATELVNPTEWYASLDGGNLLKVERLTVAKNLGSGVRNDLYLNRGDWNRGHQTEGIHIIRTAGDYSQEGVNGIYYTTDGLADYGEQTRAQVFDTRVRMDLYTLFPELTSNYIRDGRTTNRISDSNNPDKSVTSPNYWFPKGYLSGVTVNDDAIFMFESQHNTYWSYEGDEFFTYSETGYSDITLQLPQLPDGTYQLRLGFCNTSDRAVVQCYVDDVPVGVPLDMRQLNFETRTGWFALTGYNDMTDDEKAAAKLNMHNWGWYHGPRSVFNIAGEGHEDGDPTVQKVYFCNNARTCRGVIGVLNISDDKRHTLRMKSVTDGYIQLDYLEFVPKSVYEGDEDDL